MRMKRKDSFSYFFAISFFHEICFANAWPLPSLLSSSTMHQATRIRRRRRTRLAREFAPAFRRRQKRRYDFERINDDLNYLLLNEKSDETDMEEEEFYREYENKYSWNGTDNGCIENLQFSPEKQQQQQNTVPSRSNASLDNTKIESKRAVDEASMQRIVGAFDTIEQDTEKSTKISNLSDLQRKVQRIQKRNKNPSSQDTADEIDKTGENFKRNDQYLLILQKAQEKLSEMNNSNFNSIDDINGKQETKVSNVSSLQERLKQIQLDVSAMEKPLVDDFSASKPSQTSTEPMKAKILDDDTLAEWENLDKLLQDEKKMYKNRFAPSNVLDKMDMEIAAIDETDILDALRSKATADTIDSNRDVENPGSIKINSIFDEEDDSTSDTSPTYQKEFVSDFKITNDGVFLPPEAYRAAGTIANPDGSLNFGRSEKFKDSNSEGKKKNSSFVDDDFVENDPPLAKNTGGKRSDSVGTQKDVSIEDLIVEANRSLEYARNNPEAQEELHNRIIAEFEAEESTRDELENDTLLDPEKLAKFWNQEYFEKQKDEVDALEKLLDQKMGALKDAEKLGGNKSIGNDEGHLGRNTNLHKGATKDLKNIFFASKNERIERARAIEHNRRERAKNIANFYKDVEEDTVWYSTFESEEEKMTKPDFFSTDTVIDIESKALAKEKLYPSKSQDKIQNVVTKSESQRIEHGSKWVLVEDPESVDDAFYWNEESGEMRWDPPNL